MLYCYRLLKGVAYDIIFYGTNNISDDKITHITASQAADKWHISQRRVQILCSEGRITDALKLGEFWAIPVNTTKPRDARLRKND